MSLPERLPIEEYLPSIVDAIRDGGALVLSASPGAGKTTLVPPAIADSLEASGSPARKVLVLEPRRIAAASAAARIAELWGRRLGDEVGYRVRGESRTSQRALVEAVTPGVLIRMLQDDPSLEGIGCVILDEFHERSAQSDLALAFLAESRELRRESGAELRLLAMSATIDAAESASALGARLIEVPGRSFPIDTRYVGEIDGPGAASARGSAYRLEAAIARSALDLMEEAGGDVLAFLPGVAEITRAAAEFNAAALARSHDSGSSPGTGSSRGARGAGGRRPEAYVLHGSLPLEEQRRLLSPPGDAPPRAIFATSIAETSLTVPRVRAVLDSGLARLSRFQSRAGLNRLVTERESQDRADQRKGRAGRLGPGICLRFWPASESLALRTEPELSRAELSALVLEAALWGSRGRLGLRWLDPPPEGAWKAGIELLTELGALDAEGSPTPFGRRMAALGTEPRLAALVLHGIDAGEAWTACLAAAMLSERDAARDIATALEEMAAGRESARASVLAEARRLAQAAGLRTGGSGSAGPRGGSGGGGAAAIGPLLAAAFPDRIAERTEYRGASASFRLAAGRSLRASGLLSQSPWIVALEADAGSAEGTVYSACPLSEAEALAALEPRSTEIAEPEWKGLEPKIVVSRRVGAIVLGRRAGPRPSRDELAALLASRIASAGLDILPWNDGAAALLARLRHFSSSTGGQFLQAEELSAETLTARAADLLGPWIRQDGGPLIDAAALANAVRALIPGRARAALDREAPERLELPSGSSRKIDYETQGGPSVEAKVQEFFGLSEHPRVGGRPLTLRLLDPGGKPLQVTSDLPGFWKGSWAEARKQLRGRYPKHEWPEDPAVAAPSRSGRKPKASR